MRERIGEEYMEENVNDGRSRRRVGKMRKREN